MLAQSKECWFMPAQNGLAEKNSVQEFFWQLLLDECGLRESEARDIVVNQSRHFKKVFELEQ